MAYIKILKVETPYVHHVYFINSAVGETLSVVEIPVRAAFPRGRLVKESPQRSRQASEMISLPPSQMPRIPDNRR